MVKAPQLPATRLQGLSMIVKERGATNMVEASIPAVGRCIEAMQADPILSGFPFDSVTFAEIVFRVIKKGTPLERMALANHLTPEAAFFFQSASQAITGPRALPVQVVIDEIFKPMFGLLCEHFGVQFAGNMDTVAYSLLKDFGGFSFVDFLICFERVKIGRYRKDTQHIMTRGINAEFMGEWLRQYDVEREEHRAAIYDQYKPDNIPASADKDLAEKIAAYNAGKQSARQTREEIVMVAEAAFFEWENGLYTSGLFKQGFKTVWREVDDLDENGDRQFRLDGSVLTKKVKEEILCPSDDPGATRFDEYAIRLPKPGTMERKVKRILYEFVTDANKDEMNAVYFDFVERIRAKYKGEPDIDSCIEAELKTVLSCFGTMKRNFPALKLVESVLKKTYPEAPQHQISISARDVIQMFDGPYFDEYLPNCVRAKYPRLDRDEYLIVSTLPEYIKAGFENPFKLLFQ